MEMEGKDSYLGQFNLFNPPLDIDSLSLAGSPSYHPPTNEASSTSYQVDSSPIVAPNLSCYVKPLPSKLPTSICLDNKYSWLPISKGDIQKLAQTRFVNSSPNSYRLMPASVESSESDKTSFVEKSSHKFLLPVSYFIEVAKLWALSNRSELECTFTLAKTDDAGPISNLNALTENYRRRPICHVKELFHANLSGHLSNNDETNAEKELLNSVNRFLKTCEKKDRAFVVKHAISDSAGSETRRYLSQIVSLMDTSFATKLKNGFKVTSHSGESRKRPLSSTDTDSQRKRTKEGRRVNVFTVATPTSAAETDQDQIVIIHIPTSQQKVDKNISFQQPLKSSTSMGPSSTEKPHKCFYCQLCYVKQLDCARHMLSHLTSSIQT